ncbi:MAG: sulfurtransferase complex subunit TusD [Spongiibacteraceae bacterium]
MTASPSTTGSSATAQTFALMVLGSSASQAQISALNFARAALHAGHRVMRVFFFSEGVTAGNTQFVPAPDTDGLTAQWAEIAATNGIDLVVCSTSAVRRGVLDAGEARRHDRALSLDNHFDIAGLGQWVEACLLADRVVSFG